MKNVLSPSSCLLVIAFLALTTALFAQYTSMDWTQATDSAQWQARGYHTSVVFDNKMWVIGGFNSTRRNDVWFSEDGTNWTQATASAPWAGRMGHTSVVFDNKIWVIGGFSGSFRNDVWYSEDGVNWTQATAAAEWSARCYFTSVVFDNKIWILGGYNGNNLNDVWFSSDGVNWICATDSAQWSPRYDLTSLFFDNKIWVLGGTNWLDQRDEVWYSTDGVQWTLATDHPGWYRDGHTSVVFDNTMWVISGDEYYRDAWYSPDGDSWVRVIDAAPWSGRSYHTSVVFNDRIWVIGGIDNVGRKNDVWFSRGFTNLVAPNGGEILQSYYDYVIHWHTAGSALGSYRLLLSTNRSHIYTDTIDQGISSTDSTYDWIIFTPYVSSTCRIKIQALDSSGSVIREDNSDNNFTIKTNVSLLWPIWQESLPGRSEQIIRWSTPGIGISRFRLLFSRNSGSTFPDTIINLPPSYTTYPWTVPPINFRTCKIKVQMIDSANVVIDEDESEENFIIYTPIWLASSQYPMFRYNLQHTGKSPYEGSLTSNVKWFYSTSYPIASSPVISPDSTVYFVSGNNTIYALRSDGTRRWQYSSGQATQSTPAIASDNSIYVGNSYGHFMAFPKNLSAPYWRYCVSGPITSSPAIGINGVIYFGSDDGYLYALNPDSSVRWYYNLGSPIHSSPAISQNQTILIGSNQGKLSAINSNGAGIWEMILPDALLSSPAISSDGTIYIGCCNGKIYAIDRFGVVKWNYQTGDSIISSAAIDIAGRIYFGSCDGYVYSLEDTGNQANLIWRFQTQGKIRSSPSISANDIIYIGSDDGNVYAINSDGTLAWTRMTGNAVRSSPAIGADGTIYIGSDDGRLYAIGLAPGIEENEVVNLEIPKSFTLYSGQPNPFASQTTIRFGLPRTSSVKLNIYSSSGILLKTLISETKNPGYHCSVWNGCDKFGRKLPAGIYFYRLETKDFTEAKKIVKLE
jgi:outer membrane protein assembly factor BamB/N-acetylneuraminic acid mutarotase